jgi:hypothetical protein
MNLAPTRQGTSRRDELQSGYLFVCGDIQQGGSELAFDWRQNSDGFHTRKLRSSQGERLGVEEEQNMQIGKPLRTIVVEPLELPVQQPPAEPEPLREAEPQPAEAPVAQ